MKELSEHNKTVDRKILCINIGVLVFVSLLSFFYVDDDLYELYQFSYPVVLFFIFSMLLYAVLGIRKTIKQVAHAFPRERLICIHFINFVFWLVLILTETILGTISDFMDFKIDKLTPDEKLTHNKILYSSLIFTNV